MADPAELPPEIVERLRQTFPDRDVVELAAVLPIFGELPMTPPWGRVLHAIITLSEGDPARLAQYAQNARDDWRDVLYWTETPPSENEPRTLEGTYRRVGLNPDGSKPTRKH